jgi:SAM-dependent methyltransferase
MMDAQARRDAARQRARHLANDAVAAGRSADWFEPLYREAAGDEAAVPWGDGRPHVLLPALLDHHVPNSGGRRALVVGCGLGDDAEHLADRGFDVTAFDVSPTAVDWCRRRWPRTRVDYVVADAINPPADWRAAFDLVVEIYTIQAVRDEVRAKLLANLPTWLAPGGRLLVICRGREEHETVDGPPWPLSSSDLAPLSEQLEEVHRAEHVDPESDGIRRDELVYVKSAS